MTVSTETLWHEPVRRGPWLAWGIAALVAVGLHGGCIAFAMSRMTAENLDDADGAPAIEIGLEMETTHREATDLPPGPEAEASTATPSVQEQKQVAEQSDLPKDTPTETDDPDRLVTTETVQKPKEEEPTPAAQQAVQSNEAVASEATAPPSSDTAALTERSVAPTIGTGESARKVELTWQKKLGAHLKRHLQYPANRAAKGTDVVVWVEFEIDRRGNVLDSKVTESSGDTAFDQAALDLFRKASPVPAPPPLVADQGLRWPIPVTFNGKNKR